MSHTDKDNRTKEKKRKKRHPHGKGKEKGGKRNLLREWKEGRE